MKEEYGHRVRLATHLTFKSFVEENGLEFFNIGGDPAELMAFMVKNPGLMPGMDSLRAGDIGKKRKSMYEIMQGCWRSCIEMGDGIGASPITEALTSRTSIDSAIGMEDEVTLKPFVADVIIANPPSFAHMHIAEKMGIPSILCLRESLLSSMFLLFSLPLTVACHGRRRRLSLILWPTSKRPMPIKV